MKLFGAATLGFVLVAQLVSAQFKQAPLPYAYNALEGSIDAQTMEIHYSKHGAAYVANLNKAITGTSLEKESLVKILSGISKQSPAIRNNAGGHYNHELFWTILTPEKNTQPSEKLAKAINQSFGSFDAFKEKMSKAGADRFGSGWAWLIVTPEKKLAITSTANQDNPLMDIAEVKGIPVLGIDVWEHAYYLKYQNKRADYLSAIWNVINWKEINKRYEAALNGKTE
ncbi:MULTISPECIES: superoxide dismutase [Elizabethkingia]|uniref:superoxide dismutase n=1 Tax=Elizabethkingia TaxID=308865 RepID=UPI00038A2A80|nr:MULTISPECIES: superoxide dismutase [Elizabethkingia]AKH94090.1 superoxide dismutase [Elizabethkingia anophelis FMS-007]AQW95934.1 superoxide dismutase [Elizabethkingia anophelis]EQB93758.1 superoxide dismutase [Elizabethkingia anophelis 502]KFC35076.1 superoxide dismutase [Elizabethkingia anophelis]MCL1033537.1 superoxide dismutase [Elizabethkingia anophelis]